VKVRVLSCRIINSKVKVIKECLSISSRSKRVSLVLSVVNSRFKTNRNNNCLVKHVIM